MLQPECILDQSAAATRPRSHIRRLRVLIADDSALSREILRAFILPEGHEVVEACDGVEALALVTDADFDLVLMDLRMPNMDGITATFEIRALNGRRATVPIVACTSYTAPHQLLAWKAAGLNGLLTKPVTRDALLLTMRGAVVSASSPPEKWGNAALSQGPCNHGEPVERLVALLPLVA
jgi:two-component system, sensor histidine kinase